MVRHMNYKEKELDIERERARNLCHVLSSLYTLVIRMEEKKLQFKNKKINLCGADEKTILH